MVRSDVAGTGTAGAGAAGAGAASAAQSLALRYLAAFGPASVSDFRAWSGLTGAKEIIAPLREKLVRFQDESGRELLDLPDAPRPGPDVPAPTRFLAALDNVVLAYHDRSRIVTDEQRKYAWLEATVTVDGFVRGLWRLRTTKEAAVLEVRLFGTMSKRHRASVAAEGNRLLRWAAPESPKRELLFAPSPGSSPAAAVRSTRHAQL